MKKPSRSDNCREHDRPIKEADMSIIPDRAHYSSHITWRLAVKRASKAIEKEARHARASVNVSKQIERDLSGNYNKSIYSAQFNNQKIPVDPHTNRERSYIRRYRSLLGGPMFTEDEWIELCNKHHHCCARCKRFEKLTVDHIKPLSKGGKNDISNIQPLCMPCNSHKGTNDTDYRC